jgi:tetratricopeptide (TPR) repeat protein
MRLTGKFFSGFAVALLLLSNISCESQKAQGPRALKQIRANMEKGEIQKAAAILNELIPREPENAEAKYLAGELELRRKNIRGALEWFTRSVQQNPELIDAQIAVAKIRLAQKQMDEVETRADFVLSRDATHYQAGLLKCSALISRNALEQAETLLNSLKDEESIDAQLFLLLADVRSRQDDAAQAEKILREGIEKLPAEIALHAGLAQLFVKQGKTDEAVEAFGRVIALEPDNLDHPLAVAALYWDTGDTEKAQVRLDKFLSANEAAPDRRIALAQFYLDRKKKDEAEALLREGLSLAPDNTAINLALSRLFLKTGRPGEAIDQLKAFLETETDGSSPDDIRAAQLTLARIYLDHHAADQAAPYIGEVLKRNTEDVDASFLKGRMHLMKSQGDAALTAFSRVVSQRPGFIKGYLYLAQAHRHNKNDLAAAAILKKGLHVSPNEKSLHLALAKVQLARKDYKAVEQAYLKALAIDPSDHHVQAQLGDFFLALKQYKRAEREYAEIINKSPNNALGYLKLAQLYMSQQNPGAGIAELEKGYRRIPGSAQIITELAAAYIAIGKTDSAVALCNERLKANPEEAFSHNLLGKIYIDNKKYKDAGVSLKRAIELAPEWPEASNNLAALYLLQSKTALAKKNLISALERNPENPSASLTLGKIYEEEKQYDKAVHVYENAIKHVPRFWAAANNLAFLLCQYYPTQKNLERAMDLCLAAYQLKPGRIDIMDTMAWIQYHQGEYDQALVLFDKISDHVGKNPMYNYHHSLALLKAGKKDEALAKLTVAVESESNFHGRDQALETLEKLKAHANITSYFQAPLHPVPLPCKSVLYRDIVPLSRLARQMPNCQKM